VLPLTTRDTCTADGQGRGRFLDPGPFKNIRTQVPPRLSANNLLMDCSPAPTTPPQPKHSTD